jgi:hypothetical protein
VAANPDFIHFKIGDRVLAPADPRCVDHVGRPSIDVPAHVLRRAAYVRMWRAFEPNEE